MKKLPSLTVAALATACSPTFAANLMLDFGATAVGTGYFTLSPGHNSGVIPTSEITWNQISSMTAPSLSYGNNTPASGVSLVMGQESTLGTNVVDFSTPITTLTLAGTGGGTAGRQNMLTNGSIYGTNASSTSVARDGFFGGGNGTAGAAIGLRLDGLAAGQYLIYVMARNTNSNASPGSAMNVYAGTGTSTEGSFDFNSLSAFSQSNVTYASAGYAGQYSNFVNGENYVSIDITIATDASLFLAIDGGATSETRGFLNMIQIVQIPEPASVSLGSLGFLFILRRRR